MGQLRRLGAGDKTGQDWQNHLGKDGEGAQYDKIGVKYIPTIGQP